MAFVYATCVVRVTIFSTDGKFRPVWNCTELHTLTPAARSSLSTLGDVHAFVTLLMTITQECIVFVRASLVGRGLT